VWSRKSSDESSVCRKGGQIRNLRSRRSAIRNSSIVPVVGYLYLFSYLFGSSCGRCLKDLLAKVRSAMESGMLFPSVEHAYQFLNARVHGRPDLCQQILKAPTAAAAKQIAKEIQVTNDWNDRRVAYGRPSRPQVPCLSSFPTDTAFIRRFHRPPKWDGTYLDVLLGLQKKLPSSMRVFR
jgi:hypothetical protein